MELPKIDKISALSTLIHYLEATNSAAKNLQAAVIQKDEKPASEVIAALHNESENLIKALCYVAFAYNIGGAFDILKDQQEDDQE